METCHCGRPKKPRKKFCSNKCHRDFELKEKFDLWISGVPLVFRTSKAVKRAVILRDGNKCAECGITNWNGKPITLQLEHRNGDAWDDSPANLCLLCPNCHSQTPTFTGRNRGRGRPALTYRGKPVSGIVALKTRYQSKDLKYRNRAR